MSCHVMSCHVVSFLVLLCHFVSSPLDSSSPGFYLNDTTCEDEATGMETGLIPDINITASSYKLDRPPWSGRLGSHESWRPQNLTKPFLQVDLGIAYYVCAVATQGHPRKKPRYVTRYAVQLSLNGTEWTEYEKVEK